MATSNQTRTASQRETCPQCFGRVTATTTESYCGECGLVIDESPINHGPDWRHFTDDDTNPERAAPGNRNHPDRGLGSERHHRHGSRAERRRDRINQHSTAERKQDRNRAYATTEIQRMTTALELPDYVADRAKRVFRDVHTQGLEGLDLDTVAAACLYLACREQGMGRTPDEIKAVARGEGNIPRRMWWVAREIGAEVPPPDVQARVRVVAGKLDADHATVRAAIDSLPDNASASPSTVAAGVLYQVGGWTQREIGDAAGVTPTSLRSQLE